MAYVLERIREENPERRIVLVMDAPRHDIYKGQLEGSSVLALNQIVREACDNSDLEMIDLTDPMKRDYDANGIWFNSRYDGHWDEYGHEFVARTLMEWLPEL